DAVPTLKLYKEGNTSKVLFTGTAKNPSGKLKSNGATTSKWNLSLDAGNYVLKVLYKGKSMNVKYAFAAKYRPAFATTSITGKKGLGNALKIRVKEAAGATGYQIALSEKANMADSRIIWKEDAQKTLLEIGNLMGGKTYYVKARAYKRVRVNEETKTYYQKWSSKVAVKVKVPAEVPTVDVTMDGEHLTAAWYESLLPYGNSVFSPYSLKDCASILYPAAGGNTKREFEKVLGVDAETCAALRESDASAIFQDGIGMKSANKAYINSLDAAMQNANLDVLDTTNVDVRPFDGNTWQEINKYVAEATEDKIKNLLTADDVGVDTASVLLNCIYFMNTWLHEKGTVHWNGGKYVKSFRDDVSLKNIKEDGKIDILRLPYMNCTKIEGDEFNGPSLGKSIEGMDQYALYVICDSTTSDEIGVDAYMTALTEEKLAEITDFTGYKGLEGYDKGYFNVPEFEARCRTSLVELLQSLGAVDMFNPMTADFRKFADVHVDNILQEAYIKTTYTGTEAAAATAMVEKANASYPPPVEKQVIADTTFAFVLKDDTTGQILFVGRIAQPEVKE
ncbi:MAG: serpin family protein, partial [bacterium]